MILELPDNWHGVTVEQFVKLSELDAEHDILEMIAILSSKDVKEVETIDSDGLCKVLQSINWFFELPPDKYNKMIELEGKEYYLINLADLTVKEWIDLSIMCSEKAKNLHKIFSMLYKHNGSKSDPDLFLKAPIGALYGAFVFFCNIEKRYYDLLQIYLIQEMTKTKTKQTKRMRLRKALCHGMNSFTRWLKGTFSKSKKCTTAT